MARHFLDRDVDCPDCRGVGEVAVPGTYGPTVSPEDLEVTTCRRCDGTGTIPNRITT